MRSEFILRRMAGSHPAFYLGDPLVVFSHRRQPEIVPICRMSLAEAFTLFRRLGVHVETMNRRDFSISYFALAKRYHPDRNPSAAGLMANINAARTVVLNSYRNSGS